MFRRLESRKSLSCSFLFMNLFLGQSYNTIMPAFAIAFQTAPFPPLDFLIDLMGGWYISGVVCIPCDHDRKQRVPF